jgi:cytochrome c556
MNYRITVGLSSVTLVLALGVCATSLPSVQAKQQAEDENKVSKFMREKLASSQNILEGLVTEDFDKIAQGAEKLELMSKATEWQVIQGPVYAQHSSEFRRAVSRLGKMAEDKNIDGAGLTYMHVTMTCINCHKFVRSTQIAQGDPIPGGLERALEADRALLSAQ